MIWNVRTALVAVVLVVLAAFGAAQSFRLANERTAHAATKEQHALQLAEQERAGRKAEQQAREEEQRRAAALQGVIDETEQRLARALADADAAAGAGQRLRAQIAVITSSCRGASGHSGAAGSGQPADATGDLLADVQRRLDEAADGIARFADQAHAAGAACERSYQALTAGKPALDR